MGGNRNWNSLRLLKMHPSRRCKSEADLRLLNFTLNSGFIFAEVLLLYVNCGHLIFWNVAFCRSSRSCCFWIFLRPRLRGIHANSKIWRKKRMCKLIMRLSYLPWAGAYLIRRSFYNCNILALDWPVLVLVRYCRLTSILSSVGCIIEFVSVLYNKHNYVVFSYEKLNLQRSMRGMTTSFLKWILEGKNIKNNMWWIP